MTRAAVALWASFFTWTTVASVTALGATPPHPDAEISWPHAVVAGTAVGGALFTIVLRRPPSSVAGMSRVPTAVTTHLFLVVCVVNEELIWRRFVLGELLAAGPFAAVAASSVVFAVAHRSRRTTHLLTGGVFGTLYVATGALSAAVAAHWTYNALVARAAASAPRPAEAAR